MTLFFEQVAGHARVQLSRHLRSPAIWWLALAAPIGARFLVPEGEVSYSILSVNKATLALDSGVMGLQLGVIMAIILSPLAYIFLRAGPTRKTPWQTEAVAPARRTALSMGHWIADTLALWVLMLALGAAGVMLAYFRLPVSEVNPLKIFLTLSLIAAPALAVVAALRTIFSMRPLLRKAGGDVLFVIAWLVFISLSAVFFAVEGKSGSPFYDVFGFAAPLAGSTDIIINELYILGPPAEGKTIKIDAMTGVTDSVFLLSRVFWVFIAGCLVCLSGLFYKPTRLVGKKANFRPAQGPAQFTVKKIEPVLFKSRLIFAQLQSEWRQLSRPFWFSALLVIAALMGSVLPFRGMAGPAIAILLIFLLTQHGARWRSSEMSRLTDLAPVSPALQYSTRLFASILLALAPCLPALGRMFISGDMAQVVDVCAIGVGLPIIAITLGHATRGAVAGRLLLLILWYIYLNIG